MRITVVSSDLSSNALGRALVLADLLACSHEVRLVGTRFGSAVWPPAASRSVDLHAVEGARWPFYGRAMWRLVELITGDVVIAVKPLVPSFGAALIARQRRGIPVLLDLDDDETALRPISLSRPFRLMEEALDPDGAFSRRVMGKLIPSADALTVASMGLQRRFGGHLVLHAKNTDRLRPRPGAGAEWRRGLELGAARLVLFLGTPRLWKGVVDAAEAVARIDDAVLVVVGADDTPYSLQLAAMPSVRAVPMLPLALVPNVIEAADVVVIPQRSNWVTEVQMPSKLYDAMAMAKPIVATAVSDIPAVLGCDRGRVVPPGDVPAMATAIRELLENRDLAAQLGRAARSWCVRNASLHAARGPLGQAIDDARAKRSRE